MKLFATMAIVLASFSPTVEAGGRCNRTYQRLDSAHGWGQSCRSCHKSQDTASVVASGLTEIAKTKQAFEALDRGLNALGYRSTEYVSAGGGYGNFRAQGEVTYAPQGPSLYGYNAFTSRFAQTDIDSQLARASRLVENAQKLAGQSNMDFHAVVRALGEEQARAVEIAAKGQAVERAFQSLSGGRQEPQWRSMRFDISSDGQLRLEPQQAEANSVHTSEALAAEDGVTTAARDAVLLSRCTDCHSPSKLSGKLDLTPEGRAAWSPEERQSILASIKERITHPDPAKRMPLGPEGGEGTPLPLDEKQLLFDWR